MYAGDFEKEFSVIHKLTGGFFFVFYVFEKPEARKLYKEHSGLSTVVYVVGSKSFRPDIQKPRQMENAVRDI